MARDKATTKAIIKRLKDDVKLFNEQYGVSLSYGKISKQIDRIFKMNPEERGAALQAYELELRAAVADKVLTTRSTLWSIDKFVKNNERHPLMKYSITFVTKRTKMLLNGFCDLKQEGYAEASPMTKEEAKEIRDWELSQIRSRTLYSESMRYMKEWDAECFRQEEEALDFHFRNKKTNAIRFTFKNRYGTMDDSRKDIVAADTYHKMSYVKGELAKHGFFWRLFHPKQVAMWRSYITKAEDTLREIGFVEAEHKDKAIEMLKKAVAAPHDMDEEVVKSEYEKAVNNAIASQVEELTVARDLLAKNKKLDLNPETALDKKIGAILEKHNIKEKLAQILNFTNFDYAAEQYDKLRNAEEFKESASTCISMAFNYMVLNAIQSEKEINVSELLTDARRLTAVVMNHYMPVSEINELKDLEAPLYTFIFGEEAAMVPLNLYEKGTKIKDPNAPDGYRNVMPLPGTIEKAREDIKAIMAEWSRDPKKLFNEDAEFVEALSGNEREPIVVDLNAEQKMDVESVKEADERVVQHEPLAK